MNNWIRWVENKVKWLKLRTEPVWDKEGNEHATWPDSDVVRNALKDAIVYGRESMPNYDAAVAQVRQETLEEEIEHLKKVIYSQSETIQSLTRDLFKKLED